MHAKIFSKYFSLTSRIRKFDYCVCMFPWIELKQSNRFNMVNSPLVWWPCGNVSSCRTKSSQVWFPGQTRIFILILPFSGVALLLYFTFLCLIAQRPLFARYSAIPFAWNFVYCTWPIAKFVTTLKGIKIKIYISFSCFVYVYLFNKMLFFFYPRHACHINAVIPFAMLF